MSIITSSDLFDTYERWRIYIYIYTACEYACLNTGDIVVKTLAESLGIWIPGQLLNRNKQKQVAEVHYAVLLLSKQHKKELGFDPETASTTQILEMLERFLNLNKMKTKLF